MYDFAWHQAHGNMTSASAEVVASILLRIFPIRSMLDVGCGDGRWLKAFSAGGVNEVQGVDGPWTDQSKLLIPQARFKIWNLEQELDLGRRYDFAMSAEVAEHVDRAHAPGFVENMCRHADLILFGASIPFQGGYRHINEDWQSYWAGLFKDRGYQSFDLVRSELWNNPDVHFWYKQNLIIYVNKTRLDLISLAEDAVREGDISQLPLDIVHPEHYRRIASYSSVAFRPLMKQLPRHIINKARAVVLRRI